MKGMRCGGFAYQDSDRYGRFVSCVTCGYLDPEHGATEPVESKKRARLRNQPLSAFTLRYRVKKGVR